MLQFPAFPILTDFANAKEVPFSHRWIKDSLRLPNAYRSLARPSSALEPGYPPNGVANRRLFGSALTAEPKNHMTVMNVSARGLNTSAEALVRTSRVYQSHRIWVF